MSKNKFIVGRRVPNNLNNQWQVLDLDNFKINKPTVLVLGGNGTDSNMLANGYCKIVSSLLGNFINDVNILGINYNNIDEYEDLKENADIISKKIFVPLVSKNNKKIDIKTACKNVRNITILAHCLGDTRANYIIENFKDDLHGLNYDNNEINLILEQIFLISYGINTYAGYNNRSIKCLNVISPNDTMWYDSNKPWVKVFENLDKVKMSIYDKNYIKYLLRIYNDDKWDHIDKPITIFTMQSSKCFILQQNNIILIAPTALNKDENTDDHNIKILKRNSDWSINNEASSAGDTVSKLVACALCNSVANSMLNMQSDKFIPFNFQDNKNIPGLINQLEDIAHDYNYGNERHL